MPEMAITLDFNVKNGPVVKTTPLIKEPESVERNFELRKCSSHVFVNPDFFLFGIFWGGKIVFSINKKNIYWQFHDLF